MGAFGVVADEEGAEAVAFVEVVQRGGEALGGPGFESDVGKTGGGADDIAGRDESVGGEDGACGGDRGGGERRRRRDGERSGRTAEQGGREPEVAAKVGFVGGNGDFFGEDAGGVEAEGDAELG